MATYNLQLTGSHQSPQYPAHDHCAYVNEQFNGQTTMNAGHSHQVVGGQVVPGGDGHSHSFAPGLNGQAVPCQSQQGTSGLKGCNCGR